MKLFRFGAKGSEKPGVLIDEKKVDISSLITDIHCEMLDANYLANLETLIRENLANLPVLDESVRIGVPISYVSKIVCVGLNFHDHVKETGLTQQDEPILFLKSTSSITGPYDGIVIPKSSEKTDWETELGVVIGKKAAYVTEAEAMDYVTGYVLVNDVSERAFQTERGGTWDKGKGCDTFGPLGPYLVTKDELSDVNNLHMWLKLNGELMQDGSTSDFIRSVPELIAYISQFMTLLPGDVISTGSPAGAGMGRTPQIFLKNGDVIEYGIEGLGIAKQTVYDYQHGKSIL